jgi:hypothetical protein
MKFLLITSVALACVVLSSCARPLDSRPADATWKRHTIDASSRGADGVRLADANGDGLPDIATGWEEAGLIRAYLNPGPARARQPWPSVTAGKVADPEDAVFADLDGDGAVDVVSSCERKERRVYIHWAPPAAEYLNASKWHTAPVPASEGRMRWMFAAPLQVDGRHGVDIVAGGKNRAQVGWFEAPAKARDLAGWRWHPLYGASWLMSLLPSDMDGDGDFDLLLSDRFGDARGTIWLENPGQAAALNSKWTPHRLPGQAEEFRFLTIADLDRDGLADVLTAAAPRSIIFNRRLTPDGRSWETHTIRTPARSGIVKAVAVADVDLDSRPDIIFSCEETPRGASGIMWMSFPNSPFDPDWKAHAISGVPGVKYDLVEMVDLDADGDLDALTTEEVDNLGVIWYENPAR